MKNTVYTVGYQPVDIVAKIFNLVDIINVVTSRGVRSNNILKEVVDYLNSESFILNKGDYLLLNSAHDLPVINSISKSNILIFDPSLSTSEKEVMSVLRSLATSIGSNDARRVWMDSLNNLRAAIMRIQDSVPADTYFNLLTLLTDANGTNIDELLKHISSIKPKKDALPDQENMRRAVYVGDVIDPKFFSDLENKGIKILKYYPYELNLLPVDFPAKNYLDNPHFQRMFFHTKGELRSVVHELAPEILILNPGGLYLTSYEADILTEFFKPELTVYKLPGVYTGVSLQL